MGTDEPLRGAAVEPAVSRHTTAFVCITVLIDALGIGIIMPVMPNLLEDLMGTSISQASIWGGYLAFVYAAMQFVFGPVLGNLSDRFGRRPVLLVSLVALAVDYTFMAVANTIALLFLGRLLAGIAGATHATANAYIADVTQPEKRAAAFGLIGAAFGVGFIIGPVIGGIAGEFGPRVPLMVAAAIAFVNSLYGLFVLPESLPASRRRAFSWRRANPLGAAVQILQFPSLAWLFIVGLLFNTAFGVYPATWSYFMQLKFSWSPAEVGFSLSLVGIGFAVSQGLLIRHILRLFGEVWTVIFSFACAAIALGGIAFATQTWLIYTIIPFSALGAMATPAMTALMANRTPDDAQGELQGAIASMASITMIISPLVMTRLFRVFTAEDTAVYFPGAPYVFAAILVILALLPLWLGVGRSRARAPRH